MRMIRIEAVLAVCVLVMVLGGCASGPSETEIISNAMVEWKAAFEAKDVDKMMAEYSEDYRGEEGGGKEDVRDFLEYMKDEGGFDNATMNTDDAEIVIDGDTATVGPIVYTGNWGEMSFSRTLKKEEDNVWRVVSGREVN
jgi:ketosteroid isomerase-like protein